MENQTIHAVLKSTVVPIPSNEMAGAIVVNAFAILSTLALVCIFLRVSWLGVLRLLGENVAQSFFNTQLGYYAACLLVANMINALAGLMGLPFLVNRAITDNALCTSQAVVMQIGNISVAYFTVAIAIHTFNSLVLRMRQSAYVYIPTILFGWAVSIVIAILPLIRQMGPVYGPSGLSCGIRVTFPRHMLFFHILPIFVAAVLSAILYTLIFLVLRGILVIKGRVSLTLNPEQRWGGDRSNSTYQKFVGSIARSMLWYPAAYILLLVPYSVTRLLTLRGFVVPYQSVVFAFVCWFALVYEGVTDAFLLFNTFRILGPAFEAKSTTGYQGDLESFGTAETFKRFTRESKGPLQLNLTETMIKEYRGGSSLASTSSYNSESVVSYPERTADIGDKNRYITSEDINRQISPVSMLNQSIVVEAPGSMLASRPPTRVSDHNRDQSECSSYTSSSLPIPPRRPTPTPLILETASYYSPRSSPISRPTSSRPFLTPYAYDDGIRLSGVSTSSSVSGDLDITGWAAKQYADGSIPSATRNQLMLSAVKPSFPSPTASPNPSASARLRPLLLASVERTGSMALAQQYNRMYTDTPITATWDEREDA
ncbi:hypothetical protein BDP27DRAFT_1426103 [Rhodocollybia butyracea]|uniref:G-protein coupled receptors family 2 profile 2 domain-containing protein n=1 Tax=Rhodocollybia butyracea TaxID=206335 RepID=A0A9P5U349_9AGAR|nr:hypothetical protein BDP27DRAFT_1426103 [Rhodocollybia butyracea]